MLSSLINTVSTIVLLVVLTCGSVYFSCISIKVSEWPLLGLELCQNCTSQTFITLVLVVSTIIIWYSNYYIQGELYFSIYSMIMLVFTVSIILLLISGSWITTLMGWEGLGITSFFLIHTSSSWESVNNAMSTLLTMRLGDLCLFMLISVVVVGSTINNPTFGIQSGESTWLVIIAMTKSAQIPFSGWLPKAISAPTPTSALVHSSTLVTAGLILLISQSLAVISVSVLSVLYVVGLVTITVGSISTLIESSVKKAVAFSTLSQIGLACMSYGLGEFNVAYWNLVSHGITKSLLFILVGYSIHGGINQQAVGKWSGIIITGLHRLEILVSLVSLSGSGFFSGMVTKEALLECVQAVGEHIISKSLTAFTVYITLYYCIVLWSFYSNISSLSVGVYQNSASVLVLTILHTLWTIYWFSWMGLNAITVPVGFQYTETMAPVIIISGLILSIPLILWSGFPHYLLQLLGSYIITLQHYVWAQSLLINLQFIEGIINSVVLLGYHTINLLSVKATWQIFGSSVNLLTLILVFILVIM